MPTFLALQCYKCNMMQVKQEKKSSNKWICSVCNEKQSVRKVYATSMAAKDIRNFVQGFNFSLNSAQDHALAELAQKMEEAEEGSYGHDGGYGLGDVRDDMHGDRHGDGLKTLQDRTESKWASKWAEYLPTQSNETLFESSEEALENAKFVTAFPEACAKKRKGRTPVAAEELDEQFPLQQKQAYSRSSSLTDISKVKSSCKSIGNMIECSNAIHKEKSLQSGWTRKPSSGLSMQVQNGANIYHKWQLSGDKVPQRTATGVHMQKTSATEPNGKMGTMREEFGDGKNSAQKMPKPTTKMMEKPVSKWATFLDSGEMITDQKTSAVAEEEKATSKWAKHMNFDEATQRVEATQSHGKRGKFLNSGKETLPKPMQMQETSNIWSLKAARNLKCLDGLIKTELDGLIDVPFLSEEVNEEVHPLFL